MDETTLNKVANKILECAESENGTKMDYEQRDILVETIKESIKFGYSIAQQEILAFVNNNIKQGDR